MKSNKRKFRIDGKVVEKVVGPVKVSPPKADSKPTEKPEAVKPV